MRRLSKWAIVYHFAGQVLFAGVALVVLTAVAVVVAASAISNTQLLLVSLFGIIACLVSIGYPVLWVHLFGYQLDDEEIVIEKGVIAKSYDAIPYDRVQNIGIERSLLARMLGISVVHIQTAGSHSDSAKAEGTLPGIPKNTAQQLRDEIINRSDGRKAFGGL
ncbi:MAG: hypothetical protein BRC25_00135 [Parcubacteria group bacterium SW_6_46_9]|nr:MAG: hypothetical protein BRC25_00135 [Parcubacteria group bacterium SW_6_46_9]